MANLYCSNCAEVVIDKYEEDSKLCPGLLNNFIFGRLKLSAVLCDGCNKTLKKNNRVVLHLIYSEEYKEAVSKSTYQDDYLYKWGRKTKVVGVSLEEDYIL